MTFYGTASFNEVVIKYYSIHLFTNEVLSIISVLTPNWPYWSKTARVSHAKLCKNCSAKRDITRRPGVKVKAMTLKMKVMVTKINKVLATTLMHLWCEYGECSLNRSEVILLTRWWKQTIRQTEGRTDRHTQMTTLPFWPERPRGKKWMAIMLPMLCYFM